MKSYVPQTATSSYTRIGKRHASLSLSLPHSDLCFVESDSDGEWSGAGRPRSDRKSGSRARCPPSRNEKTPTEQPAERESRSRFTRMQARAATGIALLLKTHPCDLTIRVAPLNRALRWLWCAQLLWLSVFHSAASRPAEWFEYATFLGPYVVPACSLLARARSDSELPQQIRAIAEFLEACRKPATISILFRLLRTMARGRPGRRQNLGLTQMQPQAEDIHQSIASMNPSIAELHQMAQREAFSTTKLAEMYRSVLHLFKCTVDLNPLENGRRLVGRFADPDPELMRYLIAAGLLQARTEEDVERVFRGASRRLEETVNWIHSFRFVTERAIKTCWSELVTWTKRLETGHPVLLIKLGQAIQTCEGDKAEEYGRAIVSQIDRGVRNLLKNDGIDTLVAIIDCRGTSTANCQPVFNLLRSLPLALNKHYPGRLKSLHMVHVPLVVDWIVTVVKRFLNPVTRAKVFIHREDLSRMPRELHEIMNWENAYGSAISSGSSESEVCSTRTGTSDEIVPVPSTPSSTTPSVSPVRVMNLAHIRRNASSFEIAVIRHIVLFLFFLLVTLNLTNVAPRD